MPFQSTLGRSVGKLLKTFRSRDATGASRLDSSVKTDRRDVSIVTGGNLVTTPTHRYHIFLYPENPTNALSVSQYELVNVEYVMIGGGGGGGWDVGGGGGAGGAVHASTPKTFAIGSYTVSVGGGGGGSSQGTPDAARTGSNGGDTTFVTPDGTITAKGGGGGGGWKSNPAPPVSNGVPGGCGGGGGGYNTTTDAGTTIQAPLNPGVSGITQYGFNGGANPPSGPTGGNTTSGGGGGGTGAAGENGQPDPSPVQGHGGAAQPFANFPGPGLMPAIPSPYRGNWGSTVGPTGLLGAGGDGNRDSTNEGTEPAIDATGMGGIGGGTPNSGGAGGTGIVIVRYPVDSHG